MNTATMDPALLKEGMEYAEKNLTSDQSHLFLDKKILRENFYLKDKDVLDFGCGMGNTALWMARELGARVDAFDLDPNHITVARELLKKYNVPGVNFDVKNIIENPIDKQYDFIILNDVIEHIKEDWIPGILGILINRNLKPGGIIFFSYPPWAGPHASHLQRAIRTPWIQFFPKSYVHRLIKKRNQQLVSGKDLLTEYLELNHMTHRKLNAFLMPFGLKRIFRHSHTKFNKLPLMQNVNLNFFPFTFVVTKELIAFQKTN